MISTQYSGLAFILLAAFLWSLLGSLSHYCFAAGLAPLEVAFWRAFFACLCFAAHAALHHSLRIPLRHAASFAAFGIVGIGAFFSTFQLAVFNGGAATAVILLYTAPLWVALFSRLLFHEALPPRKLLAIGIALAGTMLVCFSGGSLPSHNSTLGIAFGLLAGFCYALHYPFYVWWQSRHSTATIYAYMQLGGLLCLLPFVSISGSYSWQIWLTLLALGAITGYGAYWAYGQSLQRISPVQVAICANMEPVLGTLWAWLFWQENFSPLGWAGGALVCGALLLIAAQRQKA
jgi:drug/metabolite transporter, DME family